jgi:hypothetical protein
VQTWGSCVNLCPLRTGSQFSASRALLRHTINSHRAKPLVEKSQNQGQRVNWFGTFFTFMYKYSVCDNLKCFPVRISGLGPYFVANSEPRSFRGLLLNRLGASMVFDQSRRQLVSRTSSLSHVHAAPRSSPNGSKLTTHLTMASFRSSSCSLAVLNTLDFASLAQASLSLAYLLQSRHSVLDYR